MIENEAENEQAINLAESLSHRENRSLEETTLLNLLLNLMPCKCYITECRQKFATKYLPEIVF